MRGSLEFGEGTARAGETAFELPAVEAPEWLEADGVVLACGGHSFLRTGSDGTGYALARSLGHAIVATAPALTPLVAVGPLCRARVSRDSIAFPYVRRHPVLRTALSRRT